MTVLQDKPSHTRRGQSVTIERRPGLPPQMPIIDIKVGERTRKNMGDLADLTNSIQTLGLLQPIVLLDDNTLLCGGRRVEVYRRLGWASIPYVRSPTRDDALSRLKAERDENTCRKDMTWSETVALGLKIEAIEGPAALARQQAGRSRGGLVSAGRSASCPIGHEASGSTRAQVAKALGITERNYERARRVVLAAEDEDLEPAVRQVAIDMVVAMDEERVSVSKADKVVTAAVKAPPVEVDELAVVIPIRNMPREIRLDQIRALAETGMTSHQIGEKIGVGAIHVRTLASAAEIVIVADQAMGRSRRRIDSNKIVDETITVLGGLMSTITMVDYNQLDPSRLREWTTSLTEYLVDLRKLNKEIKDRCNGRQQEPARTQEASSVDTDRDDAGIAPSSTEDAQSLG